MRANRKTPRMRRSRHARDTVRIWLIRVGAVIVILGFWELAAQRAWINPVFSGQPSRIWPAFVDIFGSSVFRVDLPTTLIETAVGFGIGSAGGIIVGFVLARYQLWNQALRPLVTAANSLPRIALAPLFIIWFGIGSVSKIALAVSLVFFILLVSTVAALTQTDRDFLLLARSLGAKGRAELFKFVLPSAVPMLAAGLELGLVYSFLGTVAGEIIGGENGLGVRLAYDANVFETNSFFAVLLLLAIVTTAISFLIHYLIERTLKWHYIEVRGGSN